MSYETDDLSLEGLTTFQLMQNLFAALLVESESIVGIINSKDTVTSEDSLSWSTSLRESENKIKSFVRFLRSLLVENDEFSETMASLYDWYMENLNKLLSAESAPGESAGNLITQAKGFVEIWSSMKNA